MGSLHTFRQVRRATGRYFLLFFTLIAVVLIAPFMGAGTEAPKLLLELLYAAIPLTVLFAIRRHRGVLVAGLIIAVPTIVAALQGRLGTFSFPEPWGDVVAALFYGFACWSIVDHLSHYDDVTPDTIFAAMSLYLLVGIIFMNAYSVLEHVHPGSIYVSEVQNADGVLTRVDLLYFSFVTMTTLGYGDITPVTAQARSITIIQAIFGVMFMAVVIGRVVGIYSSKKEKQYGSD